MALFYQNIKLNWLQFNCFFFAEQNVDYRQSTSSVFLPRLKNQMSSPTNSGKVVPGMDIQNYAGGIGSESDF